MGRSFRRRPTVADLQQDGPALSPADFAAILDLPRQTVMDMVKHHEIPAYQEGRGTLKHWKIRRDWCRDYCRKYGLLKPAA